MRPPSSYDPASIDLEAGMAVADRHLEVEVKGSDKPRTYSSGGFPEIVLRGEFFPLELVDSVGLARGLGVYVSFRHDLGIETLGPTDLGETITVDTSEQEIAFGFLFRLPLGSLSAVSPTLSFGAGLELLDFDLDPRAVSLLKQETQVPTLRYSSIIVSSRIAIPFGSPFGGIEAMASFRGGIGVEGDTELFGTSAAPGIGLGAALGFFGRVTAVDRGFHWSARVEYAEVRSEFSGASTSAADADSFPGAVDRYARALLLLGWRFL